MKVQKHIATLLLVCFSAYLVHNLIPHHHHSEISHSPLATNCPFDHEDTHEHDHDADTGEHSTYCHAFNNVVFEKHSVPVIRPWSGSIPAMLVPGQVKLPEEIQGRSPYENTVLKLPCKYAIYLGSRDLRAPPLYA